MKTFLATTGILALVSRIACGQFSPHAVVILSPAANEEFCQASVISPSARFQNADHLTRTLKVTFEIHNIYGIHLYSRKYIFPDVPAGAWRDTTFPDYNINPYILSELGTFYACASVSALDETGLPIANWIYDDTACVRIFGIRTTPLPFNDPSDEYAKTKILAGYNIPDPTKWVSIGATVVEGDSETWDPPPPRYERSSGGVGSSGLLAPVIRLDRLDVSGHPYYGSDVGDTLVSFPFNLRGQTKASLSFDFMRGGKHSYPYLWDAGMMSGGQTILNSSGDILRAGDSLIIEFKDTTEPSCNPVVWNQVAAIDGGHDFEFHQFGIRLDKFTTSKFNYFTNAFRYRLRLKADSDAAWYIDNISLQIPRLPEIEVGWSRIIVPYTKIPYSFLTALPVYFNVKNLTTDVAIAFPMKAFIINSGGDTVYSQSINMNNLRGGANTVVRAPDWNAQNADISKNPFRVVVKLASSSYDDYTQNNETFSLFYLNCDSKPAAIQEFVYDNGSNDIPSLTGAPNSGIGFRETSGSYAVKFTLPQPDSVYGARIYFASENSSDDAFNISIHKTNENMCVPGGSITQFTATRGNSLDQFSSYYFPKPVALDSGTYWLSVSQPSAKSFTMGGNFSRGGGAIIVADSISPKISPIYSDPYGTQYSPTENSGDISCAFAVEVPALSGNWQRWMPDSGWWPANRKGDGHQMVTTDPKIAPPYTGGGSYLPMIRVIAGKLPAGNASVSESSGDVAFAENPNPFSPGSGSAEFKFRTIGNGPVSLIIYDALGREVLVLFRSNLDKGFQTIRWDGLNSIGAKVPPGAYLARLNQGNRSFLLKTMIN